MIHNDCGCMRGHHIWDIQYEKEVKSEKWCICCEHFFLSDDIEETATDDVVNGKETSSNSHNSNGLKKGKIIRRS